MKKTFAIEGNICGERIRQARHFFKPAMEQKELAEKLQLMGIDITPLVISRIERNQRHVIDAELKGIAKALKVSVDWLLGETDDPQWQG